MPDPLPLYSCPFFEVGRQYFIAGFWYRILCVTTCMYGPVAWAAYDRKGGTDIQTLVPSMYKQVEEVR